MKEEQLEDGSAVRRCIYTPHSLRATTATLLLDANVDIVKVKDLLGHRHITTTQIYDKRRRSTSESTSLVGDWKYVFVAVRELLPIDLEIYFSARLRIWSNMSPALYCPRSSTSLPSMVVVPFLLVEPGLE